jgi:hypothetical protein
MTANYIIVSVEKSNKSENNVWAVAITGEEQKQAYCKSAYKAMRFAFLLKKQTGLYIDKESLIALSEQIAKLKAEKAEAEQQEPEQQPEPEAKKKRGRKPRAKKAKVAEAEATLPIAI